MQKFDDAAQVRIKQDALQGLNSLDKKMRKRLMWSSTKLLRELLVFLDIQSWRIHVATTAHNSDCKDTDLSGDNDDDKSLCEVKEPVDSLALHFRFLLEAKGIVIASLQRVKLFRH